VSSRSSFSRSSSIKRESRRSVSARDLIAYLSIATSLSLFGGSAVRATSYASVTFDELVAGSDVIFVGEVTDVRPFPLDTRDGTIIKTRVVFRVSDPLWGTTNALEVFDFLGGEWNDIGMVVAEMPRFAIGDRRGVFARREQSINPIAVSHRDCCEYAATAAAWIACLRLVGHPSDNRRTSDSSRRPTSPL
jgi:hypothetical protein